MSRGQTKCYISWAVLCSVYFMRFDIFATLYQKQNLGCVNGFNSDLTDLAIY